MAVVHILQIYKDYYPVLGGIENHVKVLAEGLAARGMRITVLATNTAPRDEIQRHGPLTIIKAARALHLASTPLSPRMLWYARCLRDVDVVNLHFPYPPGDLVARAVPGRPPLVVTYHSDIVRQRTLLQLYGPLLRRTLARATRILPTTPAYIASSPWLRPHAARCTVVPLSVDTERFTAPDPAAVAALRERYGPPLLLFVGRLRYYKGLHFLLEALPQMRRDARLLLVGTGPEEERLRAQVQAAGLGERVHFLGEVDDAQLPACYHAADAFVLPSHLRSEAFGIVQLEAQSAGLPIVCTELGTGTSHVTQHGVTGLVVPPANPPALARALDLLLANPALARCMGASARARVVREFSHARMLERMEAVYSEVWRTRQ
jgi:rhamnosyl/mannosyltransferase